MAVLNLNKRLHQLTGTYAEFAIVPAARLVPLGLHHAFFAHWGPILLHGARWHLGQAEVKLAVQEVKLSCGMLLQ